MSGKQRSATVGKFWSIFPRSKLTAVGDAEAGAQATKAEREAINLILPTFSEAKRAKY